MQVTHHSNYIRWMEEARIDFLRRIGWDYARLEDEGIISPVVGVTCRYKSPTTFSDEVEISVKVKEFNTVSSQKKASSVDLKKSIPGFIRCSSILPLKNKTCTPIKRGSPQFAKSLPFI